MYQNMPLRGKTPAKQSQAQNPFARALAETEKGAFDQRKPNADSSSLFRDALARTGSSMADSVPTNDDFFSQQEQLEKQQKKEALRRKLLKEINPVEKQDIFNAREQQVKKQLEETRKEIKLLVSEIGKLRKDLDIAAMQQVVEPGQDGTYYVSFFQQLRSFIMLLRQKIKSARTWAQQAAKKSKKKKKKSMSLEGKSGHEQTKTVYDTMHHEVSNARSGG